LDRGPLPDQIRDIDSCFAACGIPQCCEASLQRERFERLAQDFATDPIDDNGAFIPLGLRRDPHGYVKQIHHEELEDGEKERPSPFPKITLKQTDSSIQ
jgi:hypothetical protein